MRHVFAGRLRTRALALSALLLVAPPVLAQGAPAAPPTGAPAPIDPERLALAERLFSTMHFDVMLRGVMAKVFQTLPAPSSGAEANPRARQMMSSLAVGFDASLPDMFHSMVEVYARMLTKKELEDSLAFYDSPSGQAILTKMPAIMSQAMPLSFKMLPKVAAVAEQDYCSHLTCTEAERANFARMKGVAAPTAPPSAG